MNEFTRIDIKKGYTASKMVIAASTYEHLCTATFIYPVIRIISKYRKATKTTKFSRSIFIIYPTANAVIKINQQRHEQRIIKVVDVLIIA